MNLFIHHEVLIWISCVQPYEVLTSISCCCVQFLAAAMPVYACCDSSLSLDLPLYSLDDDAPDDVNVKKYVLHVVDCWFDVFGIRCRRRKGLSFHPRILMNGPVPYEIGCKHCHSVFLDWKLVGQNVNVAACVLRRISSVQHDTKHPSELGNKCHHWNHRERKMHSFL